MSLSNRVASSALMLTFSGSIARLLALVTMPVLTRLLSPEAYGVAAMGSTVISLVSVFALSGLDISYIRSYNSQIPPLRASIENFVWRYALTVSLISGGIAAIIWWGLAEYYFKIPVYIAGFVGLGVVLSIVKTLSETRARIRSLYHRISVAAPISAFVSAGVSISVAMCWRQDEMPLFLSMIAVSLVPILILGVPLFGMLNQSSRLTTEEKIGVIKIGMPSIVTAPMYWVISSLDRWFIGYYLDISSVGIYAIGCSIATIGMVFNTALMTVWLPEVSKAYEDNTGNRELGLGRLAEQLIIALGLVWLAITAAGGDIIKLLTTAKFHNATILVPYIAGAIFFHGLLHVANAGVIIKNKLHYTIFWWILGAVICIVLNLLLIPVYGLLGAAVIQTISFGFISLGILITAQFVFPLNIRPFEIARIFSVILFAGIFMQMAWAESPLISLLLKLPFGVLLVLVIIRLFAPDLLRHIYRKKHAKK